MHCFCLFELIFFNYFIQKVDNVVKTVRFVCKIWDKLKSFQMSDKCLMASHQQNTIVFVLSATGWSDFIEIRGCIH